MLGKPREGVREGRLEGNLPLERLMGNMPPFPSCPVEAELALWPRAGDRGDIPTGQQAWAGIVVWRPLQAVRLWAV